MDGDLLVDIARYLPTATDQTNLFSTCSTAMMDAAPQAFEQSVFEYLSGSITFERMPIEQQGDDTHPTLSIAPIQTLLIAKDTTTPQPIGILRANDMPQGSPQAAEDQEGEHETTNHNHQQYHASPMASDPPSWRHYLHRLRSIGAVGPQVLQSFIESEVSIQDTFNGVLPVQEGFVRIPLNTRRYSSTQLASSFLLWPRDHPSLSLLGGSSWRAFTITDLCAVLSTSQAHRPPCDQEALQLGIRSQGLQHYVLIGHERSVIFAYLASLYPEVVETLQQQQGEERCNGSIPTVDIDPAAQQVLLTKHGINSQTAWDITFRGACAFFMESCVFPALGIFIVRAQQLHESIPGWLTLPYEDAVIRAERLISALKKFKQLRVDDATIEADCSMVISIAAERFAAAESSTPFSSFLAAHGLPSCCSPGNIGMHHGVRISPLVPDTQGRTKPQMDIESIPPSSAWWRLGYGSVTKHVLDALAQVDKPLKYLEHRHVSDLQLSSHHHCMTIEECTVALPIQGGGDDNTAVRHELSNDAKCVGSRKQLVQNHVKAARLAQRGVSPRQFSDWGASEALTVDLTSRSIRSITDSINGACLLQRFYLPRQSLRSISKSFNRCPLITELNLFGDGCPINPEEARQETQQLGDMFSNRFDGDVHDFSHFAESFAISEEYDYRDNVEHSDLRGLSILESFMVCKNLTAVDPGDNVRLIGGGSFCEAEELAALHLTHCSRLVAIGAAFSACPKLHTLALPSSLISLGPTSFANCPKLVNLTLSNLSNLRQIDDDCFKRCTSLTTLSFDGCAQLELIGKAFKDCSSLQCVDMRELTKLTQLNGAFQGCTALTQVHFPTSLLFICESTLSNCTALEELDFSHCAKLRSIDTKSCSGLTRLKYIRFPANGGALKRLGGDPDAVRDPNDTSLVSRCDGRTDMAGCFADCPAVEFINTAELVLTKHFEAFRVGCITAKCLCFPQNAESIAGFFDCTLARSIKSPYALRFVDISACGHLAELTNCFSKCTHVETVLLPHPLTHATTFGTGCFNDLPALRQVLFVKSGGDSLHSNKTSINSIVDCFNDCPVLSQFGTVDAKDKPVFDPVVEKQASTERAETGATAPLNLNLTIFPDLMTIIHSFRQLMCVATITFPSKMTTIDKGSFAFSDPSCTPKFLQQVDFSQCRRLERISRNSFVMPTGSAESVALLAATEDEATNFWDCVDDGTTKRNTLRMMQKWPLDAAYKGRLRAFCNFLVIFNVAFLHSVCLFIFFFPSFPCSHRR